MSKPTLNPFASLYLLSPSLAQPEATYRAAAQAELALQALFLHLRERGFPLSLRDYQDMLRALELGYGLHTRQRLLWLCQTLWARSEDELRLLTGLFRDFPKPTPQEIANLTGQSEPSTSDPRTGGERSMVERSGSSLSGQASQEKSSPVLGMQFVGPTQTGIGLPHAQIAPDPAETFILSERPIIPLRNLIIIWRRFCRLLRSGPKTELHIEATIAERCRQGLLEAPVLVPVRRNLASLTVLIDVSESMLPWQSFNKLLVESLRESRLGQVAIYYFHELALEPETMTTPLFKEASLTDPVPLDKALRTHRISSLLIFSEADAARRVNRRSRVREVREFLARVGQVWLPVAWVNPMPAARWQGTSAARIAQLPQVSMFELTEDSLINAVDVLRGK